MQKDRKPPSRCVMKLALIIGVIFMFLYNVITEFVLGMCGALQIIRLRTQEDWDTSKRCWRAADVSFEEFKKEANRGKLK